MFKLKEVLLKKKNVIYNMQGRKGDNLKTV